jgi:3-dehydroquinate dehydratase I
MPINYCLPILQSGKDEILDTIQQHNESYRYFEVWLDYVNDVNEAFIARLIELLGERLIVLFRRERLAAVKLPLQPRLKILEQISGSLAYVDLDIGTQTAELEHIRQRSLDVKLIASYHNYEQTPDSMRLKEIIDTMTEYGPSIYKVSARCNSPDDALRLLQQLLELKAAGRRAIVLGMGKQGMATRIFGSLWGNEMVFAPLDEASKSAPGQLTRQRLDNIFNELGR